MNRWCLSLLMLLGMASAPQATPSPAQLGITPNTTPEVLQVLDNTGTWVSLGEVDPSQHSFTPASALPSGVVIAAVTADGYVGLDGSLPAGSNILTSASRACLSTDIGPSKVVVVAGGGASDGSAPLHTYVGSCAGSNYALHDASANLSSLSSDMWSIATDNSTYLANLIANNPNSHILLPCGGIGLDSMTLPLNQVWFDGCGIPLGSNNLASGVTTGTMLLVTTNSATQPVMEITRNTRASNFNMLWPGQYGVSVNPVVYGPAFADDGTNTLSGWYLDHVQLINAYDTYKQSPAPAPVTQVIHWDHVKMFAVHHAIDIRGLSEEISLVQSSQNANLSLGVASLGYGNNGYLKQYADNNGVFFYGHGDGTPGSTCSSTHVTAKMDHVIIYDDNIAFQLAAGHLQESQISQMDVSVNQLFKVDAGSAINSVGFGGGSYINTGVTNKTLPAIDYEGTCNSIPGAMTFTGNNFATAAGVLQIGPLGSVSNNGNLNNLVFVGNKLTAFSQAPSVLTYLYWQNDVSTRVTFVGNILQASSSNATASGIGVANAQNLTLSANAINGLYDDFDLTPYEAGAVTINANSTSNTGNLSVNVGTGAVPLKVNIGPANYFDVPFGPPGSAGSTCNVNSMIASNTAGNFAVGGTCNAGGTIVLNFQVATAKHGWLCPLFADITHPSDVWAPTATTPTSITMTGASGASSADAFQFSCNPY